MPASFGVHGPGRQHDRLRLARERVRDGELVVAPHLAARADVAQEVEQVEGEGVVVVDQQDHGGASSEQARVSAWPRPGLSPLLTALDELRPPVPPVNAR